MCKLLAFYAPQESLPDQIAAVAQKESQSLFDQAQNKYATV